MRELSEKEFAIVLAHVQHFQADELTAVLERLKVPNKAFLHAAEAVPLRLATEQTACEETRSRAFQEAFAACRLQLTGKRPLLKDITPLRAAPQVLEASAAQDVTLGPVSSAGALPATPFAAGPPRSMLSPLPLASVDAGHSDAGHTAWHEGAPAKALPFATVDYSAWTVERFASFSAERRALDPEAVRIHYGLRDGGEEHGLIVHFNQLFTAEPGLRERWVDLVQRRARELNRGV